MRTDPEFGSEALQQPEQGRIEQMLSEATGLSEAQLGLGLLYAQGCGVPKNLAQAYYWLSAAAKKGNEDAKELVTITQKRLSPSEKVELAALGTWGE